MKDLFEKLYQEARECLDVGEPFWTDELVREAASKFAECLRENGHDVYHLYFLECWEDVFSPSTVDRKTLKEIAKIRATFKS